MTLLGVVIGGVHAHLGFKIPLHATTYLTVSLEPIVVPPQNVSHIDYDPNIIHYEFKAVIFEILRIKVFNGML